MAARPETWLPGRTQRRQGWKVIPGWGPYQQSLRQRGVQCALGRQGRGKQCEEQGLGQGTAQLCEQGHYCRVRPRPHMATPTYCHAHRPQGLEPGLSLWGRLSTQCST